MHFERGLCIIYKVLDSNYNSHRERKKKKGGGERKERKERRESTTEN